MRFIDTQQALVTEEKQKRIERERKQAQKECIERLEMQLYNILISYFTEETLEPKDYYKKYVELSQIDTAKKIIGELTKRESEEYYLNKKYNSILKNIYNNFKIQNDYIIKEEKEAETIKKSELKLFRILKNTLDFKEYHSKNGNHYFKNNEEIYQFLSTPTQKDYIINTVTNDMETIYILNKKYMTILNSLYKPYKTQERTEKRQTIKSTQQTKAKAKNNHSIVNILLTAFISTIIISIKIIAYFIIAPLLLIFKR